MKFKRALALGMVLLCAAGCGRVAAGPSSTAVSSESSAAPVESDPEPKEVPNYYVEDTMDGIQDKEPVERLCWYLLGNLTIKEYCRIEVQKDWSISPERTPNYYTVEILAADKAPIDALLQNYDGPWAPIYFEEVPYSLLDLKRADADLKTFLEEHPEIEVMSYSSDFDKFLSVEAEVVELTDELTSFVENYPIQDIYCIMKYVPEEDWNPD